MMKSWEEHLGVVKIIHEEEGECSSASSPSLSQSLSSPPTPLHSRVRSWTLATGEPTDVSIYVMGTCFRLHKAPLVSKSGYLRRQLTELSEITLPLNITPDTFTLVTEFCYSTQVVLTPINVAALRTAAELLDMSVGDNLKQITDGYFQRVVSANSEFALTVFRSCLKLFPEAETAASLLSRCFGSLDLAGRDQEEAMSTLVDLYFKDKMKREAIKPAKQEDIDKQLTQIPAIIYKGNLVREEPQAVIQQQQMQIKQLEEKLAYQQQQIDGLNEEVKESRIQNQMAKDRQFAQLRARILDLPALEALQPLISRWPQGAEELARFTKEGYKQDLMKAQKELVSYLFKEPCFVPPGVAITQTMIHHNNKVLPGIFTVWIDLDISPLPHQKILRFFQLGMLNSFTFTLNESTRELLQQMGEKVLLVGENIATLAGRVTCDIEATVPKMKNLTLIPSKKRLVFRDPQFMTTRPMFPRTSENYHVYSYNYDFSVLESDKFIELAQDTKMSLHGEAGWHHLRLLAEGHYVQVWGRDEWRMLLPFSGDGDQVEDDKIINFEEERIAALMDDDDLLQEEIM